MRKILMSVLCAATLAACAQSGQPGSAPSGEGGTDQGVGSEASGPVVHRSVGSALGHGTAGAAPDQADQAALDRGIQKALETTPTDEPLQWQNQDNGHYGTIKPTRTFHPTQSQICREFQQTVVMNGQTQQAYGTACRQPDGAWKLRQT